MENIQLNNGQSVIIGSNRDIIDVIGEHCSYELASLVSEKMVVIDAEKMYAEERAATDADNYLRSLESAHKTMNDVWDALEEIRTYMDETKRINKYTIYQKLSEAISQIKNDL